MEFFSQYNEDRELFDIFKKKKQGFCVEVGAFDGITGSNTYFFEKLGWSCLLIEPSPMMAEKTRKARTSPVVSKAVGDTEGNVKFYIASNVETLSTMALSEEHAERIKSYGGEIQEVLVPCVTLDSILEEHRVPPIDFITIDVEGFELSVLRGFDLKKYQPRIVILEDNSDGQDLSVDEMLLKEGYVLFKRTGCNDWYAHHLDAELVLQDKVQELRTWKVKQKSLKARKEKLKSMPVLGSLWRALPIDLRTRIRDLVSK
jgi:FkbM family methyltransferase